MQSVNCVSSERLPGAKNWALFRDVGEVQTSVCLVKAQRKTKLLPPPLQLRFSSRAAYHLQPLAWSRLWLRACHPASVRRKLGPGGMGTMNPSASRFAVASHPRRPALSSFWHFNKHMVGVLVFVSKRQRPSSRWAAVPARMLCTWQR
jgi:hypothetical protein